MKTIRAIALEVADKMKAYQCVVFDSGQMHECYEFSVGELPDFAESVLAAYLAQQEPVGEVSGNCYDEGVLYCDCEPGASLYLAPPPIKPGFVMVPVEPTRRMQNCLAALYDYPQIIKGYKAMIQAAQENSHD